MNLSSEEFNKLFCKMRDRDMADSLNPIDEAIEHTFDRAKAYAANLTNNLTRDTTSKEVVALGFMIATATLARAAGLDRNSFILLSEDFYGQVDAIMLAAEESAQERKFNARYGEDGNG